jgi:hypothetical protein
MADTSHNNDTDLRIIPNIAGLVIDDEDDELAIEIDEDQSQDNRQQFWLVGRFLTN